MNFNKIVNFSELFLKGEKDFKILLFLHNIFDKSDFLLAIL